MKCPTCGAASDVTESRPGPYQLTKRRRTCHNGHKFITMEVYEQTYRESDYRLRRFIATVEKRRAMWARDALIARSLPIEGWQALGARHNLTKTAVYLAAKRGRRHANTN